MWAAGIWMRDWPTTGPARCGWSIGRPIGRISSHLAVTEIRHFGGTSIQVARRLRAMLENLAEVLPPERTALLRSELTLLQRSAQRSFPEPEDQALAHVSDLQGVGGKHSTDKALAGDLKSTPAGPTAT